MLVMLLREPTRPQLKRQPYADDTSCGREYQPAGLALPMFAD